jgi:DNA (cytosine-5)-methyltransferase 1
LSPAEYTLLEHPTTQKSGLIFAGYRNKPIRKAGVRPNTTHLSRVHKQPNRIYSAKGVHPTLPSQEPSGRFWILHNGGVRKLTVNECFKLMGFPETFKRISANGEVYQQIGNSVCVPMMEAIAFEIKRQLF